MIPSVCASPQLLLKFEISQGQLGVIRFYYHGPCGVHKIKGEGVCRGDGRSIEAGEGAREDSVRSGGETAGHRVVYGSVAEIHESCQGVSSIARFDVNRTQRGGHS